MVLENLKDKRSESKGHVTKRKTASIRGLCHTCWSSGVEISRNTDTGFTVCSDCKNNCQEKNNG